MKLLSGNEAIARGAWEAGARVGVAYPGTPSTETMEAFAKLPGTYAEWCTNEKVALEVGLGASAGGQRVLATMKHVGVNVAADPLFTAAYTGVGKGLVLLAADDPSMYSSQNEQDSHYYAQAAHVPMLDPADSAEALAFARAAYGISEEFDVPVMIRSTVRVSHTRTPVEEGEPVAFEPGSFEKNPAKWVMMPAYAKPRRKVQLERIERLKDWVEGCPFNHVVTGSAESDPQPELEALGSIGVICAGGVYELVRDALPGASVFKLGVTWPLPERALMDFAAGVDHAYVVEEASTYLTDAVRALGVPVEPTPRPLPADGELSPGLIRSAFGIAEPPHAAPREDLPPRPPALCAGCIHRTVFKELSRLKAVVMGDIGCYTLGALPPLAAMDSCVDMGASVSMAHGMEVARALAKGQAPSEEEDYGFPEPPVVAVIGDSTFAHSGLSSLVSTVYNRGAGTVCILDNRTTAMTGRQGNPVNGVTLQGRESREMDLEGVLGALGVEDVRVVDPYDVQAVRTALKEATSATDTLSVLIFRHPCVLLERKRQAPYYVTADCRACGACVSIGCPAIGRDPGSGVASIDRDLCIGCGVCAQYCPFGAIVEE